MRVLPVAIHAQLAPPRYLIRHSQRLFLSDGCRLSISCVNWRWACLMRMSVYRGGSPRWAQSSDERGSRPASSSAMPPTRDDALSGLPRAAQRARYDVDVLRSRFPSRSNGPPTGSPCCSGGVKAPAVPFSCWRWTMPLHPFRKAGSAGFSAQPLRRWLLSTRTCRLHPAGADFRGAVRKCRTGRVLTMARTLEGAAGRLQRAAAPAPALLAACDIATRDGRPAPALPEYVRFGPRCRLARRAGLCERPGCLSRCSAAGDAPARSRRDGDGSQRLRSSRNWSGGQWFGAVWTFFNGFVR